MRKDDNISPQVTNVQGLPLGSPFSIFPSPKQLSNRLSRFLFTRTIDMAINIRRSRHIRVPEPVLNHLHKIFAKHYIKSNPKC